MLAPWYGTNLARAGTAALALCFVGAGAHEHHMDKIPEGEAVSAEPIVCKTPAKTSYVRILTADGSF